MGILKWTLYAVLFLFSMLLQGIILPRMTISGIALCAVPVCVVCIAVQEGVEHSALFALLAGTVFCLSGVDCGPLYIVTLTLSAVLAGALCDRYYTRSFVPALLLSLLGLTICLCVPIWLLVGFSGVEGFFPALWELLPQIPQMFSEIIRREEMKYLWVSLVNIPAEASNTGIRITPWWVTRDGTKVCGVSRYARVADSYEGIINVPVRLYSDQQAVAGYLETAYNIKDYEFVGYDAGTVFDEVQAVRVGNVIRCIGNVKDMAKDVAMEGMYVNLRFRWIGSGRPQGKSMFTITGEDFCNRNEEDIWNFDVSDVVHTYMMVQINKLQL